MPSAVADYYQWWRRSIEQGNAIGALMNYNKVVAHSRNILAYIVSTPAIDEKMEAAIKASQGYFLAQHGTASWPSNSAALACMDALAKTLEQAEPSEVATALGLA